MFFCPCCKNLTFSEKPPGTLDICPVCYWIDDLAQFTAPSSKDGLNEVSLEEARRNYMSFRACTQNHVADVRPPKLPENPLYEVIRDTMPNCLPDRLFQEAKSLAPTQPYEVAWTRVTVNEIVSFLDGTDIAISGGDVYQIEGGDVLITHDNWTCNDRQHEQGDTLSEHVKRTHEKTLAYVNSYNEPENASILYVLVFPK